MDRCGAALRGWPCGRATATPNASTREHVPTSGCSSSGPLDKDAPCDYWLAHLPDKQTPTLKRLVGLARERWRVEQDYRELKEELGLDHFEGRSFQGWHHHVSLVCLAHLFLQSERTRPLTEDAQKKPGLVWRATRPRKPAAKPAAACTCFSCGCAARAVPGAPITWTALSDLTK